MTEYPGGLSPAELAAQIARLLELVGPLRAEAALEKNNREYLAGIRDLCDTELGAYFSAAALAVVCSEMVRFYYVAQGLQYPDLWSFDATALSNVPDPRLAEGIVVAAQVVSTMLNNDGATSSALLIARTSEPRAFFMVLAGLLSIYAGLWPEPTARRALDGINLEQLLTDLLTLPREGRP